MRLITHGDIDASVLYGYTKHVAVISYRVGDKPQPPCFADESVKKGWKVEDNRARLWYVREDEGVVDEATLKTYMASSRFDGMMVLGWVLRG